MSSIYEFKNKVDRQFQQLLSSGADKVEAAQLGIMNEMSSNEFFVFDDAIAIWLDDQSEFEREFDIDVDAHGYAMFEFGECIVYTSEIDSIAAALEYYNENGNIFGEGIDELDESDEEEITEELNEYGDSFDGEFEDDTEIDVFFGIDLSNDDEVVAIFPNEIADNKGNITCYAHMGQHSACAKEYAKSLISATPAQYRPLYKELLNQGYSKMNILRKLSIR